MKLVKKFLIQGSLGLPEGAKFLKMESVGKFHYGYFLVERDESYLIRRRFRVVGDGEEVETGSVYLDSTFGYAGINYHLFEVS